MIEVSDGEWVKKKSRFRTWFKAMSKKDFYRCLCPLDDKRINLDLGIEELRGVLLILIRSDKHK
jgi:hypothetical protein